jgi:hypothetical protein
MMKYPKQLTIILSALKMSFAPNPTPRGYSYFEDAPRDFWQEVDKNKPPSNDAITIAIREGIVDQILKGEYGRYATTFVQPWVAAVYKTPPGKLLVNNIASVSLGKSVQGAAAISHVSKVIRTHGISSFGVMVYNDGKLLYEYCKGNINGAEFGKGLFGETMDQSGDMLGWMVGASIAASIACGPLGAAAFAIAGSTVGRMVGRSIAQVFMDA